MTIPDALAATVNQWFCDEKCANYNVIRQMAEGQAKAHLPLFYELISLTQQQLGFETENFGWRESLYKGLLQTQANLRERAMGSAPPGVASVRLSRPTRSSTAPRNGFDTI